MKPWHRSISGFSIAMVGLPIFLGLLACIPVPIGNPEKSRIDPDLSGMWIMDGEGIVLIEPFDKRTWLVSMIAIKHDSELCAAGNEPDSDPDDYGQLVNALESDDEGCYGADEVELYKAWRSKFGGRHFMTWDAKGSYDDEHEFMTVVWFGFRIDKLDGNRFALRMIDFEYDAFANDEAIEGIKGVEPPHEPKKFRRAQRAVEKIVRRNADDEEMYADALEFRRVLPAHRELFIDIIDDVIETQDF